MRAVFLVICFIGTVNNMMAQDAINIMQKSYQACQAVQNGSYEMSRYMKFGSKKDTSKTDYITIFKKLPADTLFGAAFQNTIFSDGEPKYVQLYTSEELVNYSLNDSTGSIMSRFQWADEMKARVRNYKFYEPLVKLKSSPLMADSLLLAEDCTVRLIGKDIINGKNVFHVQVNWVPDSESKVELLRIETHIWINSDDYIPVQYSTAYDMVINNDTMYQFDKTVLHKYEINSRISNEAFRLSSIPDFITLEDYTPHVRPELLTVDSLAPDFELLNLSDERVKLTDLRGKVVLIDFFYKSCYPCMLALPALQKLHEKYKDQDFVLLGINPYDTKEDDIVAFLEKRGITFPVLLGGKPVSAAYNVLGYPTTYIIDKSGKIALAKSGYGQGVEDLYEEVILGKLAEPFSSND